MSDTKWIFRPHRGSLYESMLGRFCRSSYESMLEGIVIQYRDSDGDAPFGVSDIIVEDDCISDERIGWKDCRAVCVRFYYNPLEHPVCIGHCASVFEMPSDFSWLPERMRPYAMERALKHFSPAQENGGEQE